MNINNLEAFIAAAALGSFSGAARQLNVSQPTVLARVAALEKSIGSKLFLRTRHPLRLTRREIEILPFAEQIVEASGQISHRQSAGRKGARLTFRIGTHSSCVSAIVPRLSRELKLAFPNAQIDFEIGTASDLYDKMSRGSLDFCVMVTTEEMSNMYIAPLVTISPKWFAYRDSIPTRRVTGAEISNFTLVTFKRWTEVFKSIERQLRARRLWPVDVVVADNREAILSALKLPQTIGTVYAYSDWDDPFLSRFEEIDVDIAVPASQLYLCCKKPPSVLSRAKLTRLVQEATRSLGTSVDQNSPAAD